MHDYTRIYTIHAGIRLRSAVSPVSNWADCIYKHREWATAAAALKRMMESAENVHSTVGCKDQRRRLVNKYPKNQIIRKWRRCAVWSAKGSSKICTIAHATDIDRLCQSNIFDIQETKKTCARACVCVGSARAGQSEADFKWKMERKREKEEEEEAKKNKKSKMSNHDVSKVGTDVPCVGKNISHDCSRHHQPLKS